MKIASSVNPSRIRQLNSEKAKEKGPVVYWMSRDQRINNNWALTFAYEIAKNNDQPLFVVFNVLPDFLDATIRQYTFMLEGLKEVEKSANNLGIGFEILLGSPMNTVPLFCKNNSASILVTDFSPLKPAKEWNRKLAEQLKIPFFQVDAHNIIPCWVTSDKQEFAARTIRPKIHKLLPEYLEEFPKLQKIKNPTKTKDTNWDKVYNSLNVDNSVKPIKWLNPGEAAANKVLNAFSEQKLNKYDEERNNPNQEGLSNLSPYLHFGQISAQQVALKTQANEKFIEELVVRRELADNYCYYNSNYNSFKGLPDWAQKTLNEHRKDKREYTYTKKQLEEYQTHDDAWNKAQKEMVITGKMHGYMRMYWAKKILEWTSSPEEAIDIAIYLNDKYELDGRDPNGYVGVLWSIGGLHDRPWFERPIFGKVRYMNYNGLKRKFDLAKYIESPILKA